MTPDTIANVLISLVFAVLKASGLTEEEAKQKMQMKVAQVEQLPPLPMDI
jgi:hypothetical protein